MNRPAWAGTALLSCGVLLLSTTQPWVRTVTELAPGAPRTRGAVGALELVPWLAPVALVAALAVTAGLVGLRWARPVGVLAAVAAAAGAGTGVVRAVTASGPVASPGPAVVEASTTGWLWAGTAAAVITLAGVLRWAGGATPALTGPSPRGAGRPPAGDRDDPDGTEARRRQDARTWEELSDGRDPTGP